jgi:polyphosphate kinase
MEPDLTFTDKTDLTQPEYYLNRELSLIEFNSRVLKEAEGNMHPLLERLKFLVIVSSNLDEFFMIRVAGLKDQHTSGVAELSPDGLSPWEQLTEIRQRLLPLYARHERALIDDILPSLEKEGIVIHRMEDLTQDEHEYLKDFFHNRVLPVLTPLSLDQAHPFPKLFNRTLNLAFALSENGKRGVEKHVAILPIPSILKRFVRINRASGWHFVLLEQVIKANADILFPGLNIEEVNSFQVTRDADIEIADDEAEDLLTEVAEQVKQRKWGTDAVRLEVSSNMPEQLVDILMRSLDIDPIFVYMHRRPLKLVDFTDIISIDSRKLKDVPFQSYVLPELQKENVSIFHILRKKDLFLHHPYDSFTNSVLKFMNEAAEDSKVLAIKITLYRTGLNSPIVEALKRAALNGKDVTAFVELKARFDEENNIIWAKELEQVGVHVVYGVIGLKTHCKLALVIRLEGEKLQTYLHLSTGNYNHTTARLYSDFGLLTSNEAFGFEAVHLFNYLTGYSHHKDWHDFIVAPINFRQKILEYINREASLHTPENPGLIFAKLNALTDEEVARALYKASQKGVEIKLLIRGICCLKPGIPGVSDNIEVHSIIGRFLEHGRIFYFKNGGNCEMYLSSGDWMTRNLYKRVELMYPIFDKEIKKRLQKILDINWRDNKKAWRLLPNGEYEKIQPKEGEELFSAQEYYLDEIKKLRKNNVPKVVSRMKVE